MNRPRSEDSEILWTGAAVQAAGGRRAEIYKAATNGGYGLPSLGGKAGAGSATEPRQATVPTAGDKISSPKSKPEAKKKAAAPVQIRTPFEQSRALAETVVGSFVDRMTAEAERKGGKLSVADIQGLSQEFEKKTAALQVVFEQSFEEYVKLRERSAWEQARKYPFDRVLVKSFSHLFIEDDRLATQNGALSRRILPGFFMAVNMMLGPDLLESFQDRCRGVVRRYRNGGEEALQWTDIYADQEVQALLLEAQVAMASYFADLDRRLAWFVNVINGHLKPFEGDIGSPAAGWKFSESAFFSLAEALFSHLREALNSEAGTQALSEQYDQVVMSRLYKIFQRMESDAAAIRTEAD